MEGTAANSRHLSKELRGEGEIDQCNLEQYVSGRP